MGVHGLDSQSVCHSVNPCSLPEKKLNSRALSKMSNLSSKRFPARIWPRRAVSAHSHKRNSIAGPGPSKMTNLSSKKLLARIWPKRGVSAHSQKRNSIAGPGPSKRPNLSSNRIPQRGSHMRSSMVGSPAAVSKTVLVVIIFNLGGWSSIFSAWKWSCSYKTKQGRRARKNGPA